MMLIGDEPQSYRVTVTLPLWNMVDLERLEWEGSDALPPGHHTIEFDFAYDGLGSGTLSFNNFSGVGQPAPER